MKPRKEEGSTYVCSTWGYIMEKRNGKWIRQHRYRMEQHLGRKLESGEVVHHIDGDRTNNDLSNLQVMSDREHRSLHSSIKGRHSEETRLKMSESVKKIASDPEERARRSKRAYDQHRDGRFGDKPWFGSDDA